MLVLFLPNLFSFLGNLEYVLKMSKTCFLDVFVLYNYDNICT